MKIRNKNRMNFYKEKLNDLKKINKNKKERYI